MADKKCKQLSIFDGFDLPTRHSPKGAREWTKAFVERCNEIYFKEGDMYGTFCCGYHWCCEECEMKLCNCCADCVYVIKKLLKRYGIQIDYNDYDFDKWERLAREAYEQRKRKIY